METIITLFVIVDTVEEYHNTFFLYFFHELKLLNFWADLFILRPWNSWTVILNSLLYKNRANVRHKDQLKTNIYDQQYFRQNCWIVRKLYHNFLFKRFRTHVWKEICEVTSLSGFALFTLTLPSITLALMRFILAILSVYDIINGDVFWREWGRDRQTSSTKISSHEEWA